MRMFLSILYLILVSYSSLGQLTLSDYQYVIVKEQYDFQKSPNEYGINDIVVSALEKRGFNVSMNKPNPEYIQEPCKSLTLNINVKKGLATKMHFLFLDCNNNVVYQTSEAISRLKNYRKDYYKTLRESFQEMDEYLESLNVSENPSSVTPIVTTSIKPKYDYHSEDHSFQLQKSETGYTMFKNSRQVGTVMKRASGCYLVVTNKFSGIGYLNNQLFIIEYENDGLQTLSFQRAK